MSAIGPDGEPGWARTRCSRRLPDPGRAAPGVIGPGSEPPGWHGWAGTAEHRGRRRSMG
jgi:hypothetical protein